MTIRARLLAFFPLLHLIGSIALLLAALANISDLFIASSFATLAIFVLYVLPAILFRIHVLVSPIRETLTPITGQGAPKYSAWWGTHQLQMLFVTFPALEAALRLVPGAYSAWLRLWGAKIGKRVYWTPQVEILDRSLLEVGDDVVFGHQVTLCAHVVTPNPKGLRLYVKRIKIGHRSLIGARSELGPGVKVADDVTLSFATHGNVNETFTGGTGD